MPVFSSTYSPVFLTLLLIISAAASYFFYRKSLLPDSKKYFLIALKTLAIFLLLALFIEPALSSLVKKDDDELNLILVDNSRSNLLSEKSDKIKEVISDNNFLSGNYKVFTFSNSVSTPGSVDSFSSTGFETDLASSLKNIKNNFPDRTFNTVTVISDGIFNTGGNPLYEAKTFQAPFITFSVGDTLQQKDVALSNVLYNDKGFTNISTKIKAIVNAYEYANTTLNVNLLRERQIISTKTINTVSGVQNYEAEFDITESNPGKIKYRIETENKTGELTYKNNYNDFFITFADNKINILVVSGGPSYDNELLTGIIKRINNYNVTIKTAKSPNDFYEGGIDYKSFAELSAVFLLNYPTSQSSANIINDIASNVKTFKVPVIFFAGKNSDYQKLNVLDEVLPFNIGRPGSGESMMNIQTVASEDNPLSKITELNSATQIFRNVSGIQPKSGSLTLATDKLSGEPIIMTRTSGNYKSTAFLAYGLWRLRLNSGTNAEKTVEKLLIETINLTLQKEKRTKFKVYPAKDLFDYTEQVKIIAEVFDENYIPTRNAKATGKILRNDGSKQADLNFTIEENKYIAYSNPLVNGDYTIEADAELNGGFYARDNSRFFVDSLNTEYLITKTNSGALRELSENTGGRYIPSENSGTISSVIGETKNTNIMESNLNITRRFNLWENKYMLALIILLFSVEWVMRKRNNIP